MIYGLIIYLFLCYVVSEMAKDKAIGKTRTFMISLFLTPLAGILVVWMSEPEIPDIKPYKLYSNLARQQEFGGNNSKAVVYYKQCLYYLYDQPESVPNDVDIPKAKIDIRNKIAKLGGSAPNAIYDGVKR